MVKVMMYGCNGYMGHVICNLIKDMENVTVAAGIDPWPRRAVSGHLLRFLLW